MTKEIRINIEEFLNAARHFCEISDKICDGWRLFINEDDTCKSFIRKNSFLPKCNLDQTQLYKAEYIIFYNLSYGVPSFSFNVWNSSGVLISLEDIRQMSITNLSKEDFYSVITQQEHPVLFRPYFIVHPCYTAEILEDFKSISKNIIVTFLGLITPLIKISIPAEYGLS